MPGTMGAREVALLVLSACETQGAWSDGFLKKAVREARLDSRDAALSTRLCFGVLQNKRLLDFYLAQFTSLPLNRLEERVLESLRLGVYQLLFLTRVPPSAAVNESVNLARKYARNPKAAGLVNAVLRNLLRQRERLRQPDDPAVRYSHPDWLVEAFSNSLPDAGQLEALLAVNNDLAPTTAQVNTCRANTDEVMAALARDGASAQRHPWLENCLLLTDTGDLERLSAFQKGLFYVQDAAARLAITAAGPRPGMRVLDACAAPGGKSFAAAIAMEDRGTVFACDVHPHKERLISAGAERLGLRSITAALQDGRADRPDWHDGFDLVITDVPCSGLGIIRKKPDIRYKDPEPLKGLPAVQGALLDNAAQYVKPGGVLLYATCTLLRRENEDVVQSFLQRHPAYSMQAFTLPGPVGPCPDGICTLWPHIHQTDGFFIAKLRRLK